MITIKNSFMLFILIFIAYWITESINYLLLGETNQIDDEIVIKFAIINLIAIFIIAIFQLENRFFNREERAKKRDFNEEELLYREIDDIISVIENNLEEKIREVSLLLKSKLDLSDLIISVKNDTSLEIINLNSNMKRLFKNNRISLISNEHPIKKIISKAFKEVSLDSELITYNNRCHNYYIGEILNIPIISKESGKIGIITILLKNSRYRVNYLKDIFNKIEEKIAFAIDLHQKEINTHIDNSYEELESYIDNNALQQIYKYNDITKIINNETKRSIRYNNQLSAILFNIQISFKRDREFEEAFKAEIRILNNIRSSIRDVDFFGLWKKNKFIIILPQTNIKGAKTTATRIKDKIYNIKKKQFLNLNCYFSVSEFKKLDDEVKFISRLEDNLDFRNSGEIIKIS